ALRRTYRWVLERQRAGADLGCLTGLSILLRHKAGPATDPSALPPAASRWRHARLLLAHLREAGLTPCKAAAICIHVAAAAPTLSRSANQNREGAEVAIRLVFRAGRPAGWPRDWPNEDVLAGAGKAIRERCGRL